MIVTADPVGDFNATSQILRYSALAREVTVPRIPSVASVIFGGNTGPLDFSKPPSRDGERVKASYSEADLKVLAIDLVTLGDEVEVLAMRLAEEEERRREAEEGWQRAEEKAETIEVEVREECWNEMERKIDEQRRRWMGAWGDEADRNDEHLDRKLDILSRSIHVHEDHPHDADHRVAELEDENAALHRRLDALERELHCRSPTKAPKSKATRAFGAENAGVDGNIRALQAMDLDGAAPPMAIKTPGRKIRKLTPRTAGLGEELYDLMGSP